MTQLAPNDEAMAQRVAEILRGPAQPDTSKVVTQHKTLACRNCPHTRPADFGKDDKQPSAGGCQGRPHQSHDFYGVDSETITV